MVERGGLENRCALARTVGSNPTPSATLNGTPGYHRMPVARPAHEVGEPTRIRGWDDMTFRINP